MFLTESFFTNGYTDLGGLCNNDDKAPNTVLLGDVTVKSKSLDSINGKLNVHKPISDYYWDEIEYAKAAADKDNYSTTLLGVEKLISRDDFEMFKHIDPDFKMEQRPSRPEGRQPIHQIGMELDKRSIYKDVLNKIEWYTKQGFIDTKAVTDKEPHPKSNKISSKSLGIDIVVHENHYGDTVYTYPINEDFTLDLIDIADEQGLSFVLLEWLGENYFIISESVILGGGDIESDDDYPVGNIVWGEKMVPELIPSIQGNMKRYRSDPNFIWSEFEASRGMDDKKNYHASLTGMEKLINRDDFSLDKYIGKSKDDAQVMKKRLKINAKEPLGKEPSINLKVDVTDDEMKVKVKSVNKGKVEVKPGDKPKKYKDIKTTSIDKEISDKVVKAMDESVKSTVDKYIGDL